MVYIALVDPNETYPIAFDGAGSQAAFAKAWERSVAEAEAKFGAEWNFEDVKKIMKKHGFKAIKSEWIYGE